MTNLVNVFREVRRVLRSDGTLWLNLGDSYASYKDSQSVPDSLRNGDGTAVGVAHNRNPENLRRSGLKNKDLIGMPWRVALALQSDGWYLRRDIIWAKGSCMPESVRDRCTSSHEYIFHMSKSPHYYYDADAIREPAIAPDRALSSWEQRKANGETVRRGDPAATGHITRTDSLASVEGRNKRSVWTINATPFPGLHFATMPPELAATCIKAGCLPGGTVLDPFSGAGTTALTADRLQRHGIGIELSSEYAEMSRKRIDRDRGGLLDIMEAPHEAS